MGCFQHVEFKKPMAHLNEDVRQAGGQTGLQLRKAGQEMDLPKHSTY